MKEAEAAHGRAVKLFEGLRAEAPDDPEYRRGLANTLLNLGNLLASIGKAQEAVESSSRALNLYEKLAAQFPDQPHYRSDVVMVLGNLAADMGQGRAKEGEPLARRAMEVAEKLVADFPDVPEYRHRLVTSIGSYAVHLGYARRYQEKERLERRGSRSWKSSRPTILASRRIDCPSRRAWRLSRIRSPTVLARPSEPFRRRWRWPKPCTPRTPDRRSFATRSPTNVLSSPDTSPRRPTLAVVTDAGPSSWPSRLWS